MAEEGGTVTKECEENQIQKIEADKSMAPWEQHSAVISLPRFDYAAPSSILQHSHCGFLVTCTIRREKSATKEVLSILGKKATFPHLGLCDCKRIIQCYQLSHCLYFFFLVYFSPRTLWDVILLQYVDPFKNGGYNGSDSHEKNSTVKRRRMCAEDIGRECLDLEATDSVIVKSAEGKLSDETHSTPTQAETSTSGAFDLSLVKLTRSGLLLFTFPRNALVDTVDIVSNIIQSLGSGSVSSPNWCHRMFPIQATCRLNEKELQEVVSTLVKKFVANKQNHLGLPLKFAVGYNRRGIEETKFPKENADNSSEYSLLDRNKCFGIVASAVRNVVEDSIVDLKCPELSILVEWLPLSGLPIGSIIVAVSVLPINLVSTKPRLCIKALTSNTKQRSGPQ
ncbi:uncharacterized protein LOC129308604 isoform X2 [Prosopis cineraria]|uniref:uncharacterized protein LOC129308604 isoform X2 n=1 Tax=Prosopis cineraria TaxID=364024 RepID=UPI00241065FD|nr:uncharacterized protein LOC129308604 isoform X2 [Prosopis cineraria]